jgi:hypothetical protein
MEERHKYRMPRFGNRMSQRRSHCFRNLQLRRGKQFRCKYVVQTQSFQANFITDILALVVLIFVFRSVAYFALLLKTYQRK